jgi:hypothetical protein
VGVFVAVGGLVAVKAMIVISGPPTRVGVAVGVRVAVGRAVREAVGAIVAVAGQVSPPIATQVGAPSDPSSSAGPVQVKDHQSDHGPAHRL